MLDFFAVCGKNRRRAQISSERMNKDVLRIKEILLVSGESASPLVYYI